MKRITILLVLVALVALPGLRQVSAASSVVLAPVVPANSAAPQATITRVTAMQITGYQPVGAVTYNLTDTLTGSLPDPLNWYLDNFDPSHLTNLIVTWAGSGNCVTDQNNDIHCTGTLTQFQAAYSYYYTPHLYGPYLYLGWVGKTSFYTDYTIIVTYPDPLVYISSPVSPPIKVGNQLTWYQANTQELDGYGLFYDPRIKPIYLPVILK